MNTVTKKGTVLLDTIQHKDTLGTFVSVLVLQVLSFVAIAKTQGKHLGRPQINLQTLSKEQRQTLENNYQAWKNKEITGV